MTNVDAVLTLECETMNSDSLIIQFLCARELARWQCLNRAVKVTLDVGDMWATFVDREMPQFQVRRSLFEGSTRHQVMRCFAYLDTAIVSPTCKVRVDSADDLRRLEASLSSAARSARAHLAGGGSVAHVLVGAFGLDWHGASDSFVFGGNGHPALGAFQPGRMVMKLFLEDGQFRVGAKYRPFSQATQADATALSTTPFTLNWSSYDSETKAVFRGASLRMDGMLRFATDGICVRKKSVTTPMQCALTLLDGNPSLPMPQIAQTMQLDG
eukprot:TRINITY_DN4347_c0_g2_i1.p1 TRINITY_DN4347_c0_g2~~TRINITY_DN4347_c0_g2_i1.p1  ORF type:complete len:291 (-),score=24.34 TRINITY_DN4347_c0_g2_i1:193-1002(-)